MCLYSSVADHLETQIETHTAALALLHLQRALGSSLGDRPSLMTPGRRIVRFDRFQKLDRKGQAQDRVIVLLNDELLVCTSSEVGNAGARLGAEEQLSLRQRSNLADVTVLTADTTAGDASQAMIGPNCAVEVRTTEKSFVAFAGEPDRCHRCVCSQTLC